MNYADDREPSCGCRMRSRPFVSPPVMKLVREVQARGEIPAGDIASLIAAR